MELTQGDLAKRYGVTQATISRWLTSGRLPQPDTGPAKRGMRWTASAIEEWERAGFTTDVEKWQADLQIVDFARGMMDALVAIDGVHESAKALARAALRVLGNPRIRLRVRVEVARGLQQCNWRRVAIGEMTDVDREQADRLRHRFNVLVRKEQDQ